MKAIYYPTYEGAPYREVGINLYPHAGEPLSDDFDYRGYDGDPTEYGDGSPDDVFFRPRPRTDDDIKKPFVWRTHKGVALYPVAMATLHLFYTIRMIYNNLVPPFYRVGEFKRYRDIKSWSVQYLYTAMFELTKELKCRTDLDPDLEDQFDAILSGSALLASWSFWYDQLEAE